MFKNIKRKKVKNITIYRKYKGLMTSLYKGVQVKVEEHDFNTLEIGYILLISVV